MPTALPSMIEMTGPSQASQKQGHPDEINDEARDTRCFNERVNHFLHVRPQIGQGKLSTAP
jgi:hypothetical protein